jgi:NAD-dependent SIR2 family protein deacetylase
METRMAEMVLLGAGASVEAGVPGSFDMTKEIASRLRVRDVAGRHGHVISFAVGGLLFQRGIRGQDPFEGVDVEELFSAVRLLAERHTLEAAPFIGSWHAMVEEFDRRTPQSARFDRLYRQIYEGVTKQIVGAFPRRAPSFSGKDIDRKIQDLIEKQVEAMTKNRRVRVSSMNGVGQAVGEYVVGITNEWLGKLKSSRPGSSYTFDREFSKAVLANQSQPGGGEIFDETSDLMVQALKRIVWIDDPSRVEYLSPLADLLATQSRLTIATLNYDNSVERLAESLGIPCETGIEQWSQTGSFDSHASGLLLLKMHGSIDWALDTRQSSVGRPMPHGTIYRVGPEKVQEETFTPAIVFGQRNKLTAEGPFLDLLRAFQQELGRADLLTVIGYSFRDAHINEYISQWLNADSSHRMRVISPRFDQSDVEYAILLQQLLPGRLDVVLRGAGEGLHQLWRR